MFRFLVLSFIALTFTETSAGRIVGGSDANIEDFPYQVNILQQIFAGINIDICGGSILSKRVVLTAKHCVNDKYDYYIRYGSSESESGGQLVYVKEKLLHESLDSNKINDIALLFLENDIIFGDKAASIALPDKPITDGTMVTVTGWGRLRVNATGSKHLQQMTVPIVNIERCEELFKNIGPDSICAGIDGMEGKGLCRGDSGGPLVWEGKQYGVVHGGSPCATGVPDIYTNVLYFKEWIVSNMNKYSYE